MLQCSIDNLKFSSATSTHYCFVSSTFTPNELQPIRPLDFSDKITTNCSRLVEWSPTVAETQCLIFSNQNN